MSHLALYDIAAGCKVSEDFHFDLNSPMARSLLVGGGSRPRLDSSGPRGKGWTGSEGVGDGSSPVPVPLSLAGVPEEWLAYPKQVRQDGLLSLDLYSD